MLLKINADKSFTITGNLEEVHDSKTGKTRVLASTHGNTATTAQFDGNVVYMGLNMYVRK
jgi:hypothetical protein